MKFVIYKDTQGHYRWRLLASNHQVIATSGEGYVDRDDCKHAIRLVTQASEATPVEESPKTMIG